MVRVVDSSVIVAIERRGQIILDFDSIASNEPVAISTVTAAEILAGSELRQRLKTAHRHRHDDVETFIERFQILPFDLRCARIFAEVYAYLRSTGQMIGGFDLQIAATALANDADVITLNLGEFSRVPGLRVQGPGW